MTVIILRATECCDTLLGMCCGQLCQ